MKLEMKKLSSGRLGVLLLTFCTIVGVLKFISYREINSGSEWRSEFVQQDYNPIVFQWVCYDDGNDDFVEKIKPEDAVYVWGDTDTDTWEFHHVWAMQAVLDNSDFKSNPQNYIVHNHCVVISIPNNQK